MVRATIVAYRCGNARVFYEFFSSTERRTVASFRFWQACTCTQLAFTRPGHACNCKAVGVPVGDFWMDVKIAREFEVMAHVAFLSSPNNDVANVVPVVRTVVVAQRPASVIIVDKQISHDRAPLRNQFLWVCSIICVRLPVLQRTTHQAHADQRRFA